MPLPTCKADPGDAATSCLGEETNTGEGIRVGNHVNSHRFPGGAFQPGFGGEGNLGVTEALRGDGLTGGVACGGEDFTTVEALRPGGVRWQGFGVAEVFCGEGDFGATEALCGWLGERWEGFGIAENLRCGVGCGEGRFGDGVGLLGVAGLRAGVADGCLVLGGGGGAEEAGCEVPGNRLGVDLAGVD